MVHVGKRWPIYNPARCWWQYESYPYLPPTEMRILEATWTGPLASLGPTTGRGIVPIPFVDSATAPRYQGTWDLAGGNTMTVWWELGYDNSSANVYFSGGLLFNGVTQITWSELSVVFVTAPFFELTMPAPPNSGAVLAPGAVIWPDFLDLCAYQWTDPDPPPPATSPF